MKGMQLYMYSGPLDQKEDTHETEKGRNPPHFQNCPKNNKH